MSEIGKQGRAQFNGGIEGTAYVGNVPAVTPEQIDIVATVDELFEGSDRLAHITFGTQWDMAKGEGTVEEGRKNWREEFRAQYGHDALPVGQPFRLEFLGMQHPVANPLAQKTACEYSGLTFADLEDGELPIERRTLTAQEPAETMALEGLAKVIPLPKTA